MTQSNPPLTPLTPQSFQAMWDFSDPKASGQRFAEFASRALQAGQPILASLAQTQQARSLGLSRSFDQGFALLEAIQTTHTSPTGELEVRLHLERGRLHNSSGDPTAAIPEFQSAWDAARSNQLDGLAVDAAHMLAIVHSDPNAKPNAKHWNQRAMDLAIASDQEDAKKWRGSLLNNMAWDLHEEGNHQQALELFERALQARIEAGAPGPIRVAKWSIGRCLRSLARIDEAMHIQQQLQADPDADGYVHEELAECHLALGSTERARPHFLKAHQMLSQDPWLVANETPRLDRLKSLGSPE